jgi:hypothetical protein
MRVDSQVDLLVRPLDGIAKQIADLLAQLPFASSSQRAAIFAKIQTLLMQVDSEVREWAEQELASAADDHDQKLILLLGGAVMASNPGIDQLIKGVGNQLRTAVHHVSRNVLAMANRLGSPITSRSTVGDILRSSRVPSLQQSDEAAQAAFERQVREEIRRGFVTVIGRNGTAYRYAMDYYISLQAFMSRQLLLRELSIFRTQEAGFDLVQISDNPSTIGDFCDLYRGKVFSISGTHPFYQPLSVVPNGGCPMHPWCRHTMSPYMEDLNDASLAYIPDEFISLSQTRNPSTNDFQRLWLQQADGDLGAD